MTETYLAIDFGGGSGRVIAGYLSEGKLELDTVYRFPNRQIRMGKHLLGFSGTVRGNEIRNPDGR